MKKKYPNLPSGFYNINPKSSHNLPFKVYCDMTSKNGVGVTVVGHDSEGRTKVKGYEAPGSYKRKIVYNLNLSKISSLISISKSCEQFIKYECHNSYIHIRGKQYSWWVSRQGSPMKYWGGATDHDGKCACGVTNTCAGGKACNCDGFDSGSREDKGFLTDKNTLPVTELRFGDTEGSNEFGYHTLGKLLCWG